METNHLQNNLFGSNIMTVADFIGQLNSRVKPLIAKVIGEISEAKVGPTGHMYFSLKDESGTAIISCAIWRSRYELFGIQMKVGMKVIAAGHAEIYAPSGRLSFVCDSIELTGEGALKKEYDRLLKILDAQGIFDAAKKRPLPRFCRRIGVITSKQGAVIHDFINNIGKFGFLIEMIDSRVEGQLAVGDLLASIRTFKKRKIDVLVIIRGGGSLESMMAFNNETIVREIAAFPVPVIAGIGHDKDVPLASMAADAAVSTPTAAANLLSQSWREIGQTLERYQVGIIGGCRNALGQKRIELTSYASLFANFKYILRDIGNFLNEAMGRSLAGLKLAILGTRQQLEYVENTVNLNNPERQLKLGYSIVTSGGKIITSARRVAIGAAIDISLADGILNSKVISKKIHGRN